MESSTIASETKLGITDDGRFFTVDGVPTFLNGISYYGALTLVDNPNAIYSDLNTIKSKRFNMIRIWVYWWGTENDDNFSVMTKYGTCPDDTEYARRMELLWDIVEWCDINKIIVDLTFFRGEPYAPTNLATHRQSVITLANKLTGFDNIYFDLLNEHNPTVYGSDIANIIATMKPLYPNLLLTASMTGFPDQNWHSIVIGQEGVDFISQHLHRDPPKPWDTIDWVEDMISWTYLSGQKKRMPIHLQEPFREDWGYGDDPTKPTCHPKYYYYEDVTGAKIAEAAGWCFHNGAWRYSENEQNKNHFPFRCMDMRRGRLFGLESVCPGIGAIGNGLTSKEREISQHIDSRLGGGFPYPFDGTSWKIRRYHPEFEEQLGHNIGQIIENGGIKAGYGSFPGYLTNGPNITTLSKGWYRTSWYMKRWNDGAGDPLVKIKVLDTSQWPFEELASKDLYRNEIGTTFDYFSLDWYYENPGDLSAANPIDREGHKIVFQTYWYGNASIQINHVDLISLPKLEVIPDQGYFNAFPKLEIVSSRIFQNDAYDVYFGDGIDYQKFYAGYYFSSNGSIEINPVGTWGFGNEVHLPTFKDLFGSSAISPTWSSIYVDNNEGMSFTIDDAYQYIPVGFTGGSESSSTSSLTMFSQLNHSIVGTAGLPDMENITAVANHYPLYNDHFFIAQAGSGGNPPRLYIDKNGGDLRDSVAIDYQYYGNPARNMENFSHIFYASNNVYGLHPLDGSPGPDDHTSSYIHYNSSGGRPTTEQKFKMPHIGSGIYANPVDGLYSLFSDSPIAGSQFHCTDRYRPYLWTCFITGVAGPWPWLIEFDFDSNQQASSIPFTSAQDEGDVWSIDIATNGDIIRSRTKCEAQSGIGELFIDYYDSTTRESYPMNLSFGAVEGNLGSNCFQGAEVMFFDSKSQEKRTFIIYYRDTESVVQSQQCALVELDKSSHSFRITRNKKISGSGIKANNRFSIELMGSSQYLLSYIEENDFSDQKDILVKNIILNGLDFTTREMPDIHMSGTDDKSAIKPDTFSVAMKDQDWFAVGWEAKNLLSSDKINESNDLMVKFYFPGGNNLVIVPKKTESGSLTSYSDPKLQYANGYYSLTFLETDYAVVPYVRRVMTIKYDHRGTELSDIIPLLEYSPAELDQDAESPEFFVATNKFGKSAIMVLEKDTEMTQDYAYKTYLTNLNTFIGASNVISYSTDPSGIYDKYVAVTLPGANMVKVIDQKWIDYTLSEAIVGAGYPHSYITEQLIQTLVDLGQLPSDYLNLITEYTLPYGCEGPTGIAITEVEINNENKLVAFVAATLTETANRLVMYEIDQVNNEWIYLDDILLTNYQGEHQFADMEISAKNDYLYIALPAANRIAVLELDDLSTIKTMIHDVPNPVDLTLVPFLSLSD